MAADKIVISVSAPDERFPHGLDITSIVTYVSKLCPLEGFNAKLRDLLPTASHDAIPLLTWIAQLARFQRAVLGLPRDAATTDRKSVRLCASKVRRATERFVLEVERLDAVERRLCRMVELGQDAGFGETQVAMAELTVLALLRHKGIDLQPIKQLLPALHQALLEVESLFKGVEGARPKVQRRELARATALTLRQAGDSLPKHRDSVFARVLTVVLQAAGEELPEDPFDVLKDAIDAVDSGQFTRDHVDTWFGRMIRMAAPYAAGLVSSSPSVEPRIHMSRFMSLK
jgi:hypothetical protein